MTLKELNDKEKSFYNECINEGMSVEMTLSLIKKNRIKQNEIASTKGHISIAKRMEEMAKSFCFPTEEEEIAYNKSLEESKNLKAFDNNFNKTISGKIKKELGKPQQISLTGLPTDLCRSTIFHPLPRKNRKKLQDHPVKKKYKTQWSIITYEGRLLSVDDEDILLAVMSIVKEERSFTILTTYTELQKRLKITKPNPYHNKRIKDSLKRLGKASFSVEIKTEELWGVSHILNVKGHGKKIRITIDNDFYNMFLSNYTLIPLNFRLALPRDLTKLIFTFLLSHSKPVCYSIETLNKVLNMEKDLQDSDQLKEAVRQIKRSFNELQKKGFLEYIYNSKMKKIEIKKIIPPHKRKTIS